MNVIRQRRALQIGLFQIKKKLLLTFLVKVYKEN